MNEKIFEKIPEFDKLIELKSFNELRNREKSLILEYMTFEEYEDYRNVILNSKGIFSGEFSEIAVPSRIKTDIIYKYESGKSSENINIISDFLKILKHPIPVYKFGLAASIVFVFVLFLRPVFFTNTNYITKTDTLFVEKEIKQYIPATDTQALKPAVHDNIKQTELNLSKRESVSNIVENKNENNYRNDLYDTNILQTALNNIEIMRKTKTGRSINDDSLFLKFLVTVY